ncbi:GTP-binding protein [uncultured Microscilla sp.]|uniref:CobW family GTP-binding protein n=1 Tax=uncultured Microscilla sp. TaxID=432653 RepID=UPI00263627AD|nr:GTP-binding protein [uncultured Microscilla sp.]
MTTKNPTHAKTPVTIITGFLGAGKTTLLNHLIAQHPQTKFAIIENEFGEVPIDNELVVGAGDGIFELSNGCICCTLNVELGKVLRHLVDKFQDFDHLIIETTGVADPAGVAAAFVSDMKVQNRFELDSTLCLVDAAHLETTLASNDDVAAQQIAFADVLLLNKADQVSAKQLTQIQQMATSINPYAQVVAGTFAQFKGIDLLAVKAHQTATIEQKTQQIRPLLHHHAQLVSHSFSFDAPFDEDKFKMWIYQLLHIQSKGIYRIKGVLHFANKEKKIVFQSVKNQFVFEEGSTWEENQTPTSKIVFIGNSLNEKILRRRLHSCLDKSYFAKI